jgi:adenylate cyclase
VTAWRARAATLLLGPALPHALPPRAARAVAAAEAEAEVLVCLVQVAAIVMFAALYFSAERAFPPGVPFEPVPVTLAVYAVLTAIRLVLALTHRLTPPLLAASVVLDVAVLMVTIWSFHLQYGQDPAFVLKAPTLLYVFILIALRALRFEPVYVLLTGAAAALGWLAILAHAMAAGGMEIVTRDYVAYMTGARVLVGAEIDKIVSIGVVSAVLALAIVRARRVLVQASAGTIASAELARFFAPEVAQHIIGAERAVRPGDAELRHGAALMVDLRGFSALAATLDPPGLMRLLADYQAAVVPLIAARGGSIDKFLGDGILASFGAVRALPDAASRAMQALEDIAAAGVAWEAPRRAAGLPAPAIGAAAVAGPLVFGAIGDPARLEYTVLGDPVNLAAKLEKHTKAAGVAALATAATAEAARAQGWLPRLALVPIPAATVEGIAAPVDLVALRPPTATG